MTVDKRLMGKRSRASGSRFELKTRKDLESKGWTVSKWTNTVDLESGTLINSRAGFGRKVTGFPDFVAFKRLEMNDLIDGDRFQVMGVECKSAKYLNKIEKAKCQWYLDNKIFGNILIAFKSETRGKVEYKDF